MKVTIEFEATPFFLLALRSQLGRPVGRASATDAQHWAQSVIGMATSAVVASFQLERVNAGTVCPVCETEALHRRSVDGRRARFACVKCGHVWAAAPRPAATKKLVARKARSK